MRPKDETSAKIIFETDYHDLIKGRNMAIKAMKEIIPIFKSEFERFDKNIDFSLLSEKQLYNLFIRKLTEISMSYSDRKFWIDYDENNDRFIIKVRVFDDYPGNTLYAVSISVLPDIHAINKPFHDFICMVLSILSSRDVPVINSNYYGEWELDSLSSIIEDGDSTFELEREMKLYRRWHMKYRKLLSSNFFDRNKAIRLLDKSSLPEYLYDSALNWMLKTEKMDNIDWNLDTISSTARHVYIEEQGIEEDDLYNDGNPVEIDQVFRILWFNDKSYIHDLCAQLGETQGNFGEIYPYTVVDCRTKEDFDTARKLHEDTFQNIPELLMKSFEIGSDLFDDIREYVETEKAKKCKTKKTRSKYQLSLPYTEAQH